MLFTRKARGSIIYRNGVAAGSSLIGQSFDTAIYFSSRPSSTGYNPLPSGGSNLGVTNSKLKELVKVRTVNFIRMNLPDSTTGIPSEMVFASASGLDPHISMKAALLQVNRICIARNFTGKQKLEVFELVKKHLEPPQLGIFGEPRINVLLLNTDLDTLK